MSHNELESHQIDADYLRAVDTSPVSWRGWAGYIARQPVGWGGLTAVNDSRIDEHLAAVDAAELWAGEPPF